MDTIEALRSIRYDLLEYIQEKVVVDYDNILQMPVDFTHRRKRYVIRETLGRFRTQSNRHMNGYLARAGHLCPELVIGGRVCEYAQKFLPDDNFSLIAENCTSAIDAIQVLLGVTFGNQRLKVFDFGRHKYTFLLMDKKREFRLSLKKVRYGDEEQYRMLSEKIIRSEATIDDAVDYQRLLDDRIRTLIQLNPGDMFDSV
ncbi:MAG: formylmethanofuran dehydrogenase subunit E family protein [Desulfobacterales bacterium]|nr:formylmethanofuran dehydrogenase subunit E family protein [Desulfobacterales bacterium]